MPLTDLEVRRAVPRGKTYRVYDTKTEITGHGLRAMARTILHERLRFPAEVIEHQLAHRVPDSLGSAYNRTRFIDDRVAMMQAWADYLDRLEAGPEMWPIRPRVSEMGAGECTAVPERERSGLNVHGMADILRTALLSTVKCNSPLVGAALNGDNLHSFSSAGNVSGTRRRPRHRCSVLARMSPPETRSGMRRLPAN